MANVLQLAVTVCGVIITGVAALTAIGWLLRRYWNGTKRLVHAAEVINRELNPNGGGSTYDQVRAIGKTVEAHTALLAQHDSKIMQATTAAGLAVNEAKAGWAQMSDKHDELVGQIIEAARRTRLKEVAYVNALNLLGVPLTPIADEVIERDQPPEN